MHSQCWQPNLIFMAGKYCRSLSIAKLTAWRIEAKSGSSICSHSQRWNAFFSMFLKILFSDDFSSTSSSLSLSLSERYLTAERMIFLCCHNKFVRSMASLVVAALIVALWCVVVLVVVVAGTARFTHQAARWVRKALMELLVSRRTGYFLFVFRASAETDRFKWDPEYIWRGEK